MRSAKRVIKEIATTKEITNNTGEKRVLKMDLGFCTLKFTLLYVGILTN